MPATNRRLLTVVRRLLPGLSLLAPLGLYVATACRDLSWGDTTELMLAGRFLTLPHPPGYPLLTLILRLVTLLPVLPLPFRLNLVATLAAASSCLVVFLMVRQLTQDPVASLFGSFLWAVGFEPWNQATVLEVYALNVLFVAGLLAITLSWSRTGDNRLFLVGCYLFGLALANHLTVLLWLPTLVISAGTGRLRSLSGKHLGLGLGLVLLGVGLYLYVPLRSQVDALTGWAGASGLKAAIHFISGRLYRYRLLAGGSTYLVQQFQAMPGLFGKQFLLGWLLLIPGLAFSWTRQRRLLLGLLLGAGLITLASFSYNIPDKEGYLLPAYLSLLLIAALGLAALRRLKFRPWATALGFALLVPNLIIFYPQQDRSALTGLHDLSTAVLEELPSGSVLFTDDFSIYQAIRWSQLIEAQGPDILPVMEYLLVFPWYLETLTRRSAGIEIPAQAQLLSQRLWSEPNRLKGAAYGEFMKARIQDIKLILVNHWHTSHQLYWVMRDFQNPPDQWQGYRLALHGLAYQITTEEQLPTATAIRFTFPGPDRYSTVRFRDSETGDLCRRFAATALRRGILHFAQNNPAAALQDFDLSLAYYPDYPAAIENKGLVFFFTNQPDSSRYYLNRFLELAPDSPEIPKVKSFLSRLES